MLKPDGLYRSLLLFKILGCVRVCVCVDPSVMLEDLDFAAALGGSTSGTKPKSKRAAKKAVPKDGELPVT